MAENNRVGLESEKEPPAVLIDFPVVRKKFRVTIDVEATLAAEPRAGEALLPALENAPHARALIQRLLGQPELVDQILRCRAVEAARQAGKALETEHGWGRTSSDELLGPIFAELEPEAQAYFTEELEDGASTYYFDGYRATVERVSVTAIDEG